MKLLSHNMLACHVKGCDRDNFPLKLVDIETETVEAEFNPDFIRNMMAKIEWSALVSAAEAVGVGIGLPEAMPEPAQADDDFLKSVHTVLMEVDIQSGRMVCPRCDHVYVITDGIPNMLLHEDEV